MTIVVQNWYFPREGLEDAALDVRRAASRVRAEAGQPVGRILIPAQRIEGVPHFIWECDYPNLAAREADAAWADASPAFTTVRERMGALLARFERVVFTVDAISE